MPKPMTVNDQAKKQGEWWDFLHAMPGFPEGKADALYDEFCEGMDAVLAPQRRAAADRAAKAAAKEAEAA